MTTVEVSERDRRAIEEMNDRKECGHKRIYESDGMWCCADCPAYAWNKRWFYDNTAVTRGLPKTPTR